MTSGATIERLVRQIEDDMVRYTTAKECGKSIMDIEPFVKLQKQVRDLAEIVRKLNGS